MGYVRYIGADVLVTDEKSLLHYVVLPRLARKCDLP
jgi:hypothetical protein